VIQTDVPSVCYSEEAIKADRRVDPNVLFEQKTIAKFSGYLPEDCRATLHSATATSKALSDAADAYRFVIC
jgi:hypothetical protein